MKVQGSLLRLQETSTQDYLFIVDCSGITEPGSYELPVTPQVPGDLVVLSYEPDTITLDITSREEESID